MRLRNRKRIVAAVVAAAAVILLFSILFRSSPASLTISTATRGGTYVVIGEQLGRILEDLPGERIQDVNVLSSAGSSENLDRLVGVEVDVAFATRHAFDALDLRIPGHRERRFQPKVNIHSKAS